MANFSVLSHLSPPGNRIPQAWAVPKARYCLPHALWRQLYPHDLGLGSGNELKWWVQFPGHILWKGNAPLSISYLFSLPNMGWSMGIRQPPPLDTTLGGARAKRKKTPGSHGARAKRKKTPGSQNDVRNHDKFLHGNSFPHQDGEKRKKSTFGFVW